MASITYIEFNGTAHVVEVKTGHSIMEGAVRNGLPGIVAECGGNCSCATCHVYVDERWLPKIGNPEATEAALLEFVAGVAPNSRLSCQMIVTDALDGLVVRMPENQGLC